MHTSSVRGSIAIFALVVQFLATEAQAQRIQWGSDIVSARSQALWQRQVIGQMHVVGSIADAYAVANGGRYSSNVWDIVSRRLDGYGMEIYWRLTFSPIEFWRINPVDGTAVIYYEVGYSEIIQDGRNIGYTLTAYSDTRIIRMAQRGVISPGGRLRAASLPSVRYPLPLSTNASQR